MAPSAWVRRWSHLIAQGGSVLDLACGSGRHARWLAGRGHRVTGVDRDAVALVALAEEVPAVECLVADLESGPWPLDARRFDGVVVTNYLWRPLWPPLLAAVADGGTLIFETFADGQQLVGRPARPDFLLRTGELLQVCSGLRVVAYEDGFEADAGGTAAASGGRYVQRIVAVRPAAAQGAAPRYGLAGPAG